MCIRDRTQGTTAIKNVVTGHIEYETTDMTSDKVNYDIGRNENTVTFGLKPQLQTSVTTVSYTHLYHMQ